MEPLTQNGVVPGQAPEQPPRAAPAATDLGPGPQMTDQRKGLPGGRYLGGGTLNGGYRKEVNVSPMGPQCLWRAVGK